MSKYVLGHYLKGEGTRLALMAELLDPMHRRYIDALEIVKPGARTLEVGCGNGSISAWLAKRVSPGGRAVAFDLDVSLVEAQAPNVELRQGDIVAGPAEPGSFDLVTARAVLHHIADAEAAIKNLVASVRPGGALLLIEPDFLPVSLAERSDARAFWERWDRVVAGTQHRLLHRTQSGAPTGSAGFAPSQRQCRNGRLERRFTMGQLLGANDHRTSQ